jgi:osmotically-inducible protein OsmY
MADKNRDQWRNPYNQDWDQNENRYNRDQDYQQRSREYGNVNYDRDYDQGRRDYGNYNQSYGSDYQGDYNRRNYGRSEGFGSSSYMSDSGRSNYGDQYRRENEYGGGYMGTSQQMGKSSYNRDWDQNQGYGSRYGTSGGYRNSYGTSGAFGNMEGDWDRRRYNQGWGNRENDWRSGQRTSFGEQGYYGGNYERSNYPRSDYDRNRERGYPREDRSWWDKTTDEVSSWFGDEEAERRRERDKILAGQHRGKGPKGYSRSDDRIREDVSDRLSDDDYVDASDIDVQVNNSEVILSGTVDSREAKRRAEDIAERISGVRNVENRLHVGSERLSVGGSTTNISNTSTDRNLKQST